MTPALSLRLRAAAPHLVDDRTGVVHALEAVRPEAGAPAFFHYAAQPCNLSACGWQHNPARLLGCAADREQAALKALAEALRCYCAAFYDPEELPLCARAAAPFPCAPAESFALYSEAQYQEPEFPFARFDDAARVRWAPATDLCSGQPCHVPAAMVRLPYQAGDGEAPICPHTASGLACGEGLDAATVAALCGVIRDDALAIAWQAGLAPPHLRVETLSDANYDLVARLEHTGVQVILLDLTLDLGVPVILAALRKPLVFAAGVDLDPEEAVRQALEDLPLVLRLAQSPATTDEPGAEHLAACAGPEGAAQAAKLFKSRQRREFDELPITEGERQRVLVDRLAAAGHTALVADLTTPDLRPLGLTVVRAVIPGLHPLVVGHPLRALGGARLWQVPARLGYAARAQGEDTAVPHPYLCKGLV